MTPFRPLSAWRQAVLVASFLIITQVHAAAQACTLDPVVTSNADSGPGTLRQALLEACSFSFITFDMSQVVSPINLTSGELVVTTEVAIEGPGANLLTVQRASGMFRILRIQAGLQAAVFGLTLANGDATASPGGGGAIYNEGGFLLVSEVELVGNTSGSGGAIVNDGALGPSITFVEYSTLRGNSAVDRGGAIFNQGPTGALQILSSTISSNTAGGDGGGVYNAGPDGYVEFFESTITNNRAGISGAGTGGGLRNDPASVPFVMFNTIVAGNFRGDGAGATRDDITGALDELGASFNLIGVDTDLMLVDDGTNIVGSAASPVDPRLAPLANNGGGTQTHALLPGSPALDAGDESLALCGCSDQRGPDFPRVSDAADADTTPAMDIGAFEADPIVEALGPQSMVEEGSLQVTFNVGDALTPFDSIVATSSNTALVPNAGGNLSVTGTGSTRTLTVTPVVNGAGTTIVTVTATKTVSDLSAPPFPGSVSVSSSASFTLTVNGVADTPSLTGATTVANAQSVSGLVFSRNPADGAEVTHVKIVAVTGGTLFQADGATSIAAGSFITVPQAAAGLRFAPAANSLATGQVTVRASVGATDAGLGGDPVTADITVTRIPTMTAVVTSRTASAPGQSVTFTATVTPASAAAGGSVQFRDGTTALGAPVIVSGGVATFTTAALARGLHRVSAEFGGSALGLASTGSVEQAVIIGRRVTIGADAGAGPHVRQFGGLDGSPGDGPLSSYFAFSGAFSGGVRVAEADISGDGVPDVISGAGAGGPPQVVVHDGATGSLISSFFAFDPSFRGGVYVAAGDIDGDGRVDVIAGADSGAEPHVRVFSGASGASIGSFLAADPSFNGGVRVAAGDIDGDGRADIITGTGPSANARVRVFSGATSAELLSFDAYAGFLGGVYVAAGDVNGDGYADVITGAGAGGGPHVKVFDGRTGETLRSFFAGAPTFAGGVRVAAGDVNGDGRADIITALGPGGAAQVRVFDGVTTAALSSFAAFQPYGDGVFVASAVPESRAVIDAPASGTTVRENFRIHGWAIGENAAGGTGVDAIHIWAYPASGADAIFLGSADLGDRRPDVAAIFGEAYVLAGYHLDVMGLAEGTYDIRTFVHDSSTGRFKFSMVRTTRVTVRAPTFDVRMNVDLPRADETVAGTFRIAGWALETGGTRIETVHVWVTSPAAVAPVFLGVASLGDARPDVAAAFGPLFGAAGFHLDVTGLADGPHTLLVFPKALGAPGFATAQVVRITVGTQ